MSTARRLAVAGREDPCYQQVLCERASLLMGLALNRSRREKPSDGVVRDKIARAKLMMIDNLSEPLSAQQIARRLNVELFVVPFGFSSSPRRAWLRPSI